MQQHSAKHKKYNIQITQIIQIFSVICYILLSWSILVLNHMWNFVQTIALLTVIIYCTVYVLVSWSRNHTFDRRN